MIIRSQANYTHRPVARWMIEEYPELGEIFNCDEGLADTDLRLWRKEKQRVYKAIQEVADLVCCLGCMITTAFDSTNIRSRKGARKLKPTTSRQSRKNCLATLSSKTTIFNPSKILTQMISRSTGCIMLR